MQALSPQQQNRSSGYVPTDDLVNLEQRDMRALIDEVASTRALMVLMSYRLMAFHGAPDAAARATLGKEFQGLRDTFKRNMRLMYGQGRFEELPKHHIERVRAVAAQHPEVEQKLIEAERKVDRMANLVAGEQTLDFAMAHSFMNDTWPSVSDQITTLVMALWTDMDSAREHDLKAATQAALSLGKRLNRLEHIGKHVRLVSLNASVEASRAGDVGKGLMVIAHEFKTLAEEIQVLAKDARADVTAIEEHT